jgi:hypothetical protein
MKHEINRKHEVKITYNDAADIASGATPSIYVTLEVIQHPPKMTNMILPNDGDLTRPPRLAKIRSGPYPSLHMASTFADRALDSARKYVKTLESRQMPAPVVVSLP